MWGWEAEWYISNNQSEVLPAELLRGEVGVGGETKLSGAGWVPFPGLQCEVEVLLLLLPPLPQPSTRPPVEGVHPSLALWPENSLRAKEPVFTLLGSVLASASHTVDAQKVFVTKWMWICRRTSYIVEDHTGKTALREGVSFSLLWYLCILWVKLLEKDDLLFQRWRNRPGEAAWILLLFSLAFLRTGVCDSFSSRLWPWL